MADVPTPTERWFHLTPDRLILGLLALEGLLFLSERFHWFAFNDHKGWTVLIAVEGVGFAMLFMLVSFAAGLLFRCRFQFSIRSLLVLTLAAAIPCSWLSWEMKKADKQKEAVQEIKKLGSFVEYDYEFQQSGNTLGAGSPGPAWLCNLLREDFFAAVASAVAMSADARLGQLVRQRYVTSWQGTQPIMAKRVMLITAILHSHTNVSAWPYFAVTQVPTRESLRKCCHCKHVFNLAL